MTLHVPAEMYQCKLRWRLAGDQEEMISTIGLRNSEPGERVITDVARVVYQAWIGAFPAANLGSNWSFVGVDVAQGSSPDLVAVGSYDAVQQGAGDANTLPQNSALLVRKRTALAGRHNSGRMFLPCAYLGEQYIGAHGEIAPAGYGVVQPFLNQFYANLIDTTSPNQGDLTAFIPVLFHNDAALAPTDISSLFLDPVIATQRRRLRR